MAKDKCIICGVETPYDFETHIDMRLGYIEGAGQLCRSCFNGDKDVNDIIVPFRMVENTPNDQELGGKVRELYWQSKK
jgi:hypothetical protein